MSPASWELAPIEHPQQVTGELVATRRVGAYYQLTFAAPGMSELARRALPGQFVALAVGSDTSATLLRRCFSIHKVSSSGTVDIVVAARGTGTRWLADLRPDDRVNVIGPLGRGFPMPDGPAPCVLVGGGYGSAPLFWLAAELRERGCSVEIILGAATQDRLFGVAEARSAGRAGQVTDDVTATTDDVTVTTDDGSVGVKGRVSDVLPDVLSRSGAQVVYGCGPMQMLRAITDIATAHGAIAHMAVEESMACGIGVCMTCVMPVTGSDGQTRMARSCVEGPVFRGDLIRWEAFEDGRCLVPQDAYGAAAMEGG